MDETEFFESEIEDKLKSIIEECENRGMSIAVFVVTADNEASSTMRSFVKTPGVTTLEDVGDSMWPKWMKPTIMATSSEEARDALGILFPIIEMEAILRT